MTVRRIIILLLGLCMCTAVFSQDYELPKVPGRIKTREETVDYICRKFWKKFRPSRDVPGEQMVVDFLTVLSMASEEASENGMKSLFRKFRSNPEKLASVSETVEKYLYDSSSPMYDEALFERYLKEEKSPRAAFILDQMESNRVGTFAADFTYFNKDGCKFNLSDSYMKSEYVLLIFFDDDCSNCKAMFRDFEQSNTLMLSGMTDRVRTIAVDLAADVNTWFNDESELPEICEEAILADPDFFIKGKYLFKAMPGLYLLDKDGTVLLKDATVPEIEFFLDKYR